MKILLDTNFIVTCAKEHIDFGEDIHTVTDEDVTWIVPQQVLNELGNLKDNSDMKRKDRDAAALSFEILQRLDTYEIVDLGKHPNVDVAIVNYILDKDIVLATLDKGLKQRLQKHKMLTIRGKKSLDIIS